jgi:hypothetical protein
MLSTETPDVLATSILISTTGAEASREIMAPLGTSDHVPTPSVCAKWFGYARSLCRRRRRRTGRSRPAILIPAGTTILLDSGVTVKKGLRHAIQLPS